MTDSAEKNLLLAAIQASEEDVALVAVPEEMAKRLGPDFVDVVTQQMAASRKRKAQADDVIKLYGEIASGYPNTD